MERRVYTDLNEFREQNESLKTGLCLAESCAELAAPLTVGTKTIPNRLACQAMEGCDGTADGRPDTLTKRRYDRLAKGGAGMIWFEATAVMEEGRANSRQLYLSKSNLDAFRKQVEAIKETCLKENGYEPLVLMQATHSGRYSKPKGTPAPIIAYMNPLFEKDAPLPSSCIATDDYLDRVGEALVEGAVLAEKAGFDGVDIKCCHRYLNCELLSAYLREGRYGGTYENRTRLLRESIKGALASCGKEFLVSSRLNIYDGFPYPYGFGVREGGGLTPDLTEPIRLVSELSEMGVLLLNLTMGNPYVNPHVNRPFAKGGYDTEEHPLEGVARVLKGIGEVKKAVPQMKILSSALSYLGVAAPFVAASLIQQGAFDLAGFGRTIFAYPDFAKDILQNGTLDPKKICLCCSKCTEIMRQPGGTPGCAIRDRETYLPLYRKLVLGES